MMDDSISNSYTQLYYYNICISIYYYNTFKNFGSNKNNLNFLVHCIVKVEHNYNYMHPCVVEVDQ